VVGVRLAAAGQSVASPDQAEDEVADQINGRFSPRPLARATERGETGVDTMNELLA
jgi:hypothetical protein